MKKGNRAHSISRPAGSSARTHNQAKHLDQKKKRGPTNVGDPRLAAKQPTVYHRRFSIFVLLAPCFCGSSCLFLFLWVLVSALSGLLDSARSGFPLLAGDEWSFSLLFRFGCAVAVSFGRVFVVCCCFPWLLGSALLFVFGVGSAWPVLSLHRSPLLCPRFSPLVHAGPVSVLLVPPSGYWLYLRRPRCHVLHCVL